MKIIHFADLHLGVENYGRINPQTGLSTRLEDFLRSFDEMVDYAIDEKADLVLFCGDAYKTREPTQTQQREFAKRINRLVTAGLPVFLLVGNHDMPNAAGRATATEIFATLDVPGVTVAGRPGLHVLQTASGPVQVVALPWLRRSNLLSREEARNLTMEDVNAKLQQSLTDIIKSYAERLDASMPAFLAAHVWVTGARLGSERMMTIGQEHTLMLSSVANPAFDYVALGHIHKHQVLNETPPVVYAGSMERVDFGEEADDKGFYVVEIIEENGTRKTTYEFHPVRARRFVTVDIKLGVEELDPTGTILNAVKARQAETKESIVRLTISLPSALEGQLRDADIREALKEADYLSVALERQRTPRTRSIAGADTAGELAPLAALKAWLEQQQDMSKERREELVSYGEKLMEDELSS